VPSFRLGDLVEVDDEPGVIFEITRLPTLRDVSDYWIRFWGIAPDVVPHVHRRVAEHYANPDLPPDMSIDEDKLVPANPLLVIALAADRF